MLLIRHRDVSYDKDIKKRILLNRGIAAAAYKDYLSADLTKVNSPLLLGEEKLKQGLNMLTTHINNNSRILIVVDSDCDGYTSAALLYNYLFNLYPEYSENNIDFYLHPGKEHGLSDCLPIALKYNLVICPDAATNDIEQHKILTDNNVDLLVLDHHEVDVVSPFGCIINSQLTEYPNKDFSGVGVTWQFCRYMDIILNTSYSNNYLDLVALGNIGDMMSMISIETKAVVFEGLKPANIKNPFIYAMSEKQSFSLNKGDYQPSRENGLKFTPMGAAFFIVPFINAVVRSGNPQEKELIFHSMLNDRAYNLIPSTKRGEKGKGIEETLVDQAIRTCVNVKNRQTKAENAGLELLEEQIYSKDMLNKHKVLLFTLEQEEIDKNIAGLVANKLMNKYQRPVAVLLKYGQEYRGSARGYNTDFNFKELCKQHNIAFAAGHAMAFGLGISAQDIEKFQKDIDNDYKGLDGSQYYYIDHCWDTPESIDKQIILDIADMNDYWGKDLDRSLVCVKNIKIIQENLQIMKANTIKINLPNKISLIKFNGTDEEVDIFKNQEVTINVVCKCCINEWGGEVNPQLQMVAYDIIEKKDKILTDLWNF